MSLWIILYACGAVQALLLSIALWRRPVNADANRVLAVWLLLIALDLAVKSASFAEIDPGLRAIRHVFAFFPFLHASLFYLYVRTLVGEQRVAWRDGVHALGFGVALAWFWIATRVAPPGLAETMIAFTRRWFDPVLFTYALAYIGASLQLLRRYRRALRRRRSDADRLSMRWLLILAIGQLVIWGIAAGHWLTQPGWIDHALIYAAVAVWVCLVGYCSLAQPPVVEMPLEPATPDAALPSPEPADADRARDVEARLAALMTTQQLYREPALTIAQLSRRSGYPEYLVSMVINHRLGGNFWEYVNRHRIDAARRCLADPDDRRTILTIAYDCGFTSKSTFNAAFKRLQGETPSGYRQRQCAQAPV